MNGVRGMNADDTPSLMAAHDNALMTLNGVSTHAVQRSCCRRAYYGHFPCNDHDSNIIVDLRRWHCRARECRSGVCNWHLDCMDDLMCYKRYYTQPEVQW